MARNVEVKVRLESLRSVLPRVVELAEAGPIEIDQDDTFFASPRGRLKLREMAPDRGELIYYEREDLAGPKLSSYAISETSSPASLRQVLGLAYPIVGRVRKHRTLFLAGPARLHLDRVEGLGDFLEIEVVLQDGETIEAGAQTVRDLLAAFGLSDDRLVETAYVDLLASGRG